MNKMADEKMRSDKKILQENRVGRPVKPTNCLAMDRIRQGLFLYEILRCEEYIKISMNKNEK